MIRRMLLHTLLAAVAVAALGAAYQLSAQPEGWTNPVAALAAPADRTKHHDDD